MVRSVDLDPTSVADHEHFTRLQRRRGAMSLETKQLLEELDKRFAAQDKRFDDLERKLDATATSSTTRLDALESATRVFDEWRPGMEGMVDDLRIEVNKLVTLELEVGKISKYWERSMVDALSATPGVFAPAPPPKYASAPASPSAVIHDTKPVISPTFKSAVHDKLKSAVHGDFQAAGRASAGVTAEPPHGHHVDNWTREGDLGVVTTLIPPLGKGTLSCRPPSPLPLPCPPLRPPPPHPPQPHQGGHWELSHQGGSGGGHTGKLPKFDFPRFEGDHPKLWIKQAVHYFELSHVESAVWARAATMHFHGTAKRWLSSVED